MNEQIIRQISQRISDKKSFFATQKTKDISFRIEALKRLRATIRKRENEIAAALKKDLGKSAEESYMTETSIVLQEIDDHINHCTSWAQPKRVDTPLPLFPARSKIIPEPLGVVLILAPWNYPFQLLINPLIGAISAGCCAILKPSTKTPAINHVMKEIIAECFEEKYISIIEGEGIINDALLEQRFDMIFFTGSPRVGKIIMTAAAKHLTPVLLELGGKNPCIVDKDANISVATRRIMWGKTLNAGQTCIAPDYIFVHHSKKDEFVKQCIHHVEQFYGTDIENSPYYPKIIDQQAMERLEKLLKEGNILFGGKVTKEARFISPTLLDDVTMESQLMKEEIFGPLLPIFTFENIEEVFQHVLSFEKPLASYYFGGKKNAQLMLDRISSGGVVINDVLLNVANANQPFGGVGNSGMGSYHGVYSFNAFSHHKSIVTAPKWFEIKVRYAPYKFFKWVKKIL
jgi:aldehyde dehydrogenase (NAD+)